MKETNAVFDIPKKKFDGFAVSQAEIRRISWHLENLKIVHIGRFQNNRNELTVSELQNKHFI